MRNISPVVNQDLCTQCGTCVAVCPVDAILLQQHRMRGLIPVVDENLCIDCQKCVKVCPGKDLDMDMLQKQVFGSVPTNPYFGHFFQVYSGYATDTAIRYNGASGGVVSAILIALLNHGIIDGALVVKMSGDTPLDPKVYIASNPEEVIAAQQSKYIPVPMNVGLKLMMAKKDRRYAMIGLPCHLHGLRLAERLFPQLNDQIVLRLGLFCGFNPTLNSTKFLLTRSGVKDFSNVSEIKYRDGDWPCGFRAIMKDGSDHFLYPIDEFLFSHYVFERHRCAMCQDHLAELADISLGDEWRFDLKSSAEGWSFVMTRTSAGQEVIDLLVRENILHLDLSSKDTIWGGQNATSIFKKQGTFAFARIRKFFRKAIPNYLIRPPKAIKRSHLFGALLIYVITSIMKIDFFWRLCLFIPTRIFTKFRWLIIKVYRDW